MISDKGHLSRITSHPSIPSYVPLSHEERYFFCSSVSTSISMPIERELQQGDLVVELLRDDVDLVLKLGLVLHQVLGGERLVGEAHVHHAGRVAFGGGQVDQAAIGQQVDLAPVGQDELLDEVAHFAAAPAVPARRGPGC